jgi:uncharacterized protein (UPF0332 family)
MIKNFSRCLQLGKIKRFSRGKTLAPKEIRLAEEDLKTALKSWRDKNFRWCVIQLYYSMFHSARALLYFKNYREHSHYCLIEAIKELYIKTGKISPFFLDALQEAKSLREAADYLGEYSSANAKKLLGRAEEFVAIARKQSH